MNCVTFSGDFKEFFGAVSRPAAWPSFAQFGDNFFKEMEGVEEWDVLVCTEKTKRGASIIAQSVRKCGFTQSYVVTGHPDWLHTLFVDERSVL
ncbi:hypothetical protein Bca101_066501 [Brassica carinata]